VEQRQRKKEQEERKRQKEANKVAKLIQDKEILAAEAGREARREQRRQAQSNNGQPATSLNTLASSNTQIDHVCLITVIYIYF